MHVYICDNKSVQQRAQKARQVSRTIKFLHAPRVSRADKCRNEGWAALRCVLLILEKAAVCVLFIRFSSRWYIQCVRVESNNVRMIIIYVKSDAALHEGTRV